MSEPLELQVPFTTHTPCAHVRYLLEPLMDGTLPSILARYARAHLKQCKQCTAVLEAMLVLQDRLKRIGTHTNTSETSLSQERRVEMEKRLRSVEERLSIPDG